MTNYEKHNFSKNQVLTADYLNLMDDGIFNNATFYKTLNDNDYIILENNTKYITSENLTALNISIPDVIDDTFSCALDFGCGETPTNFIYSDIIMWSGDSLNAEKKFVPIREHRYHIDLWFDGLYVRGNASGVIV